MISEKFGLATPAFFLYFISSDLNRLLFKPTSHFKSRKKSAEGRLCKGNKRVKYGIILKLVLGILFCD
jgi:hypothetical protein